jgi:hypothetical protein
VSTEIPFVPFVVFALSVSMVVTGLLSQLQNTPPPACICRDATHAGELGHAPGCPAGPPTTYLEFRDFRGTTESP